MQVSSVGYGFRGVAAYRPQVTNAPKTSAKASSNTSAVAPKAVVQAAVLPSSPAIKRADYPTYKASLAAKSAPNELKTQVVEALKELGEKAKSAVKALPGELAGAATGEAVKQGLSNLPGLGKTVVTQTALKPGFPVWVGSKVPTAGAEILGDSAGGLVSGAAKGAAAAAAGSTAKAGAVELLGEAAAGPIGLGVAVVTNVLLTPQLTVSGEDERAALDGYAHAVKAEKTLYKPNPDTVEARTVPPPGTARSRLRSLDQQDSVINKVDDNITYHYNESVKKLYKPNPDTVETRTVAPPGNARFRLRSLDQ